MSWEKSGSAASAICNRIQDALKMLDGSKEAPHSTLALRGSLDAMRSRGNGIETAEFTVTNLYVMRRLAYNALVRTGVMSSASFRKSEFLKSFEEETVRLLETINPIIHAHEEIEVRYDALAHKVRECSGGACTFQNVEDVVGGFSDAVLNYRAVMGIRTIGFEDKKLDLASLSRDAQWRAISNGLMQHGVALTINEDLLGSSIAGEYEDARSYVVEPTDVRGLKKLQKDVEHLLELLRKGSSVRIEANGWEPCKNQTAVRLLWGAACILALTVVVYTIKRPWIVKRALELVLSGLKWADEEISRKLGFLRSSEKNFQKWQGIQ